MNNLNAGMQSVFQRQKENLKASFNRREVMAFYILVIPFVLVYILMKVVPIVWGVIMSFTNYTGYNFNRMKYVGLNNYINVFKDNDAMYSLFRTIQLTLILVPSMLIIGVLMALILNNALKGVGVYRTIFYIPSIVPAVATGMMWKTIYSQNGGLLNMVFEALGLRQVNWLGYDLVSVSLVIMILWGSGSSLLVNLAGLKGIPRELYESAIIDGAGNFQRLRFITLPMLTPVIFFNLIMGMINVLQLQAQPALLTPDSTMLSVPLRPNYTCLVHIYQQIFAFQRFGYGLALVWVMFAVILVLTLVIFKTSRYWVYYEVEQEKK